MEGDDQALGVIFVEFDHRFLFAEFVHTIFEFHYFLQVRLHLVLFLLNQGLFFFLKSGLIVVQLRVKDIEFRFQLQCVGI